MYHKSLFIFVPRERKQFQLTKYTLNSSVLTDVGLFIVTYDQPRIQRSVNIQRCPNLAICRT